MHPPALAHPLPPQDAWRPDPRTGIRGIKLQGEALVLGGQRGHRGTKLIAFHPLKWVMYCSHPQRGHLVDGGGRIRDKVRKLFCCRFQAFSTTPSKSSIHGCCFTLILISAKRFDPELGRVWFGGEQKLGCLTTIGGKAVEGHVRESLDKFIENRAIPFYDSEFFPHCDVIH